MSEIENTSCVRSVIKVTPVYEIEREPWGAASILRGVNDRVYICKCSVISDEYKCKIKNAFLMTFTSKLCINKMLWVYH